jgi:hypothetical protein
MCKVNAHMNTQKDTRVLKHAGTLAPCTYKKQVCASMKICQCKCSRTQSCTEARVFMFTHTRTRLHVHTHLGASAQACSHIHMQLLKHGADVLECAHSQTQLHVHTLPHTAVYPCAAYTHAHIYARDRVHTDALFNSFFKSRCFVSRPG